MSIASRLSELETGLRSKSTEDEAGRVHWMMAQILGNPALHDLAGIIADHPGTPEAERAATELDRRLGPFPGESTTAKE